MKRRHFSTTLLGAGAAAGTAALALPNAATAQGGPIEGRHYIRLTQPVPVAPDGTPRRGALEPLERDRG